MYAGFRAGCPELGRLEPDDWNRGLISTLSPLSDRSIHSAHTLASECTTVEIRLKREFGVYPNSVEGRRQGEWILMDYVDFIVHVFSAEKRAFYGLERLRKSATTISVAELNAEVSARITKTRAKKKAPVSEMPARVETKAITTKRIATKTPSAKKASIKKSVANKSTSKSPTRKAAKKTAKK
jgi:ribosome-associated protein